MRPLAEAQRDVLAAVPLLPIQEVTLAEARGLVLAAPVVAPHDIPPFDNSAMDGYAVLGSDVARVPVSLDVIEDVAAGHVASGTVTAGAAIKIMTGAPIPQGADTVVKVEDTEGGDGTVRVLVATPVGTAVRLAGGDMVAGGGVFEPGERLSARHIAVLASLGVNPTVRKRPLVAVLSTGDEVVDPATIRLEPGQIRDSNRPLAVGLLEELGADVLDLGIVGDDADALRAAFLRGAADADALLTSGGVSMGEYDLVKTVLGELGTVDFWRVAIQPAKPFAFGHIEGTPLFGLPGNPVSVMVAFEQFARPALLQMMGAKSLFRPRIEAIAEEPWTTDPAKTVFTRVRSEFRSDGLFATPSGPQNSNVLSALAKADAFAVIPVGTGAVAAGDTVVLELFGSPESRTATDVLDNDVLDTEVFDG
jgi:molybdopterin molybdotransferase